MRRVLFLWIATLWVLGLFSQTYPLSVQVQTTPPLDLKLSNYTQSSFPKITFRLITNDVALIGRQVRIKLRIEGGGLNIQNPDVVIGANNTFITGTITTLSNLNPIARFR